MTGRRVVRVSPDFFDQLDGQLGAERGPAGEPSATDFVVADLPTIVERFAVHFDALPEALASVRDGGLHATIEQFPGGQSSTAVKALVEYLRNGTAPEELILLEPIAITADNIDQAERLSEIQ